MVVRLQRLVNAPVSRRWLHRLVLLVSSTLCIALPARAQWQLLADGESVPWVTTQTWPADSVHTAALHALHMLQQDGYLFARIDSQNAALKRIYATRGERALVGRIDFVGASRLDPLALQQSMPLASGIPLTASTLDASVRAVLEVYVAAGYHFASVAVAALTPSTLPYVDVTLSIEEGKQPPLLRVELAGATRTRAGFVRRTTGLVSMLPLLAFDAERLRMRLEATGAFESVGMPRLLSEGDTSIVVRVPVREAPPGTFDLALGYERANSGRGALVGSGNLKLRNLFGQGRILELALHRAPGQVSKINVQASDPFIIGMPLSLLVQFRGLQQDSTFGKRDYTLELGYWLDQSMQFVASVTREITRPGLTGLTVVDGHQRIPVATATLAGAGIRIRQVDHGLSPRRGYQIEMMAESGYKDTDGTVVRADTTREMQRHRQRRLRAQGRVYVPVGRRQSIVTGGEARLMRSREIDESDLFRFGGATSLRGYDEERFRAPFVARLLLEYRYFLDEVTYGFLFSDLGFVDARRAPAATADWYPGFGLGFQLDTDVGVISLTLAANSENPTTVRAHIGVSLGL